MSDIHEFPVSTASGVNALHACRVSYTLNNAQPVRCTIIGDQPLFYMDNQSAIEDDGEGTFFDTAELDSLEEEIESLKKEIEAFEKLSEVYAMEPDSLSQDFMSDKALMTESTKQTAAPSVDTLMETLGKSRLAKAYLEHAEQHKVSIQFCAQVEDATYERKTGLILINPTLSFADQVMLAVRELRRHWQHRQGALINPLLFHPDNAILINRIQSADLTIAMIRTAWELQLSGERDPWNRIEHSSLSDLGHAFAREAFLDFRTINNGAAAAAVMESWFLSERCRHEDKKMIKQMLADYKGYVFDQEEAHKNVTPSLISALGTVPFGKNYLASHTHTLMNDPLFTEVRDRSNANFLWFIKFERSFRETERDLQSSGSHAPSNGAPAKNKVQSKNYEKEQAATAEIVTLYAEQDQKAGDKSRKTTRFKPPSPTSKRSRSKDGANVVYLRRWSGE